ncbi:MAG: CehA/McbA family metallohydrolase [Treponema sp.]|jgi:hypothetical protein|nr:CehA/McbA family metallohydrolase [Treponema sp.]
MIYKRAELHNHSTESDGTMTVDELIEYGAACDFGILGITDHNTCSGHQKALGENRGLHIVPGVEVTTLFGHILALGHVQMPDWRDLDPRNPEPFFHKLRARGAGVIGIAHPFCVSDPIVSGCRCRLNIQDWTAVDYIEVFNTAVEDRFSGNRDALALWEGLALQGLPIAALSGKDIHAPSRDRERLTSFIMLEDGEEVSNDTIFAAIRGQRVLISRGPLFRAESAGEGKAVLYFDHSSTHQGWNRVWRQVKPLLEIRADSGEICISTVNWENETTLELPAGARGIIFKLYEGEAVFENLLAVGAPFYPGKSL